MGPEYFPLSPISPHLIPYSPTKATQLWVFEKGRATEGYGDGPVPRGLVDETRRLSRKGAQESRVDVITLGINGEGCT